MKSIMKFTYEKGNKIIIESNNGKYKNIFVVVIIILCILSNFANDNMVLIQLMTVMAYIAFVLLQMFAISCEILLSVNGFIKYGFLYYFELIGVCILLFEKFDNYVITIILTYIIAGIVWWCLSLIANNKVAGLINQILSSIFALLVVIKDMVLSFMQNDSTKIFFEKLWNYVFSPILAINIIALMLCAVKGYWIEKYNNGNDITQDMMCDDKINNI